ncbi:MAG TPA: tetratricopeptide repeat protein [Candidatus Megaira endosymbiont of Nemacystus decipiens]|nr:tetratricopeptide repeat protein [Candidatus Megaera endosymbiont of Nemacystus decipiens]
MALLTKSKKLHFELFLTANKLIFFEIGALFLQNTRLFSFKNSLKMLFLDFVNSAIVHAKFLDYDKALIYFKEAAKKYQNKINNPDIAASYNNLGAIYVDKGEYDLAIKQHREALKIKLKAYEDTVFVIFYKV